jgi:hypothetical protein
MVKVMLRYSLTPRPGAGLRKDIPGLPSTPSGLRPGREQFFLQEAANLRPLTRHISGTAC